MSVRDANPVDAKNPKRVAIVIANPALSTTTGWPVGFWWSELTHPWFAFTERGYAVEIFSPDGGKCEADALSDPRDPSGYPQTDLISLGFLFEPEACGPGRQHVAGGGDRGRKLRRDCRRRRPGADVHL